MTTYTKKRILVIFTGGTVAGNVAESNVSQNTKSDPNSFMAILENSVDKDTYFLGAKGLWLSPQIDDGFKNSYVKEFEKQKLKHYILFDPRVKKELPQVLTDTKAEIKILPEQYAAPGGVDIFGNYVATFTKVNIGNIGENITIFVMIKKELADTYRTWFQMIWDMCPEPTK